MFYILRSQFSCALEFNVSCNDNDPGNGPEIEKKFHNSIK